MGTLIEHQGEPPSSLHEALWLTEDWRERELSSVERLTRMARQALPGSSDARWCFSAAAQSEGAAANLAGLIGLLQRAVTEQAHQQRGEIANVRRFAEARAIRSHTLGSDGRDWLDLLAIIERSAVGVTS